MGEMDGHIQLKELSYAYNGKPEDMRSFRRLWRRLNDNIKVDRNEF
jgi:ribosomal protein L20